MNELIRTAPPRIYLQVSDDADHYNEPWSDQLARSGEVTWCDAPTLACEVPYVRNDEVAHLRGLLTQALAYVDTAPDMLRHGGDALNAEIRAALGLEPLSGSTGQADCGKPTTPGRCRWRIPESESNGYYTLEVEIVACEVTGQLWVHADGDRICRLDEAHEGEWFAPSPPEDGSAARE